MSYNPTPSSLASIKKIQKLKKTSATKRGAHEEAVLHDEGNDINALQHIGAYYGALGDAADKKRKGDESLKAANRAERDLEEDGLDGEVSTKERKVKRQKREIKCSEDEKLVKQAQKDLEKKKAPENALEYVLQSGGPSGDAPIESEVAPSSPDSDKPPAKDDATPEQDSDKPKAKDNKTPPKDSQEVPLGIKTQAEFETWIQKVFEVQCGVNETFKVGTVKIHWPGGPYISCEVKSTARSPLDVAYLSGLKK